MKKMKPAAFRRRIALLLRAGIQVLFFLVIPSAFSSAFSGIKEIFTAFSQGAELSLTSFARILLFLLIFTIIFGRFFCGYACAFGAIGDWIYALSSAIQRKVRKRLPQISRKMQIRAQYIKYAILLAIVILCFTGHQQFVNENSPWTVFSFLSSFHIPRGDVTVGGILLVLILIGMAACERFFCQFLCPMGAVFSMLPVVPFGQLRRDREQCLKGCSACLKSCPVVLELEEDSIRSGECIRCNKCADKCPKKNISIGALPIRGTEPIWIILQAVVLLVVLLFLK